MVANFVNLDSLERLDELFKQSYEKPVILFKHSNACPISFGVRQIVSGLDADINLVVVQTARHVSNAIEDKTGIRHESPQAIALKDGRPVYHASHYDITAEDLKVFKG